MTQNLVSEWEKLLPEFENIEKEHDVYVHKVQEMTKCQDHCQKVIKEQYKLLNNYRYVISKAEKEAHTDEDRQKIADYAKKLTEAKSKLKVMQADLPVQSNGFYLNLILGSNLNLSLPNNDQRYKYKQEYEDFKWKVTIAVVLWALLAWAIPWRVVDSLGLFLLVW